MNSLDDAIETEPIYITKKILSRSEYLYKKMNCECIVIHVLRHVCLNDQNST